MRSLLPVLLLLGSAAADPLVLISQEVYVGEARGVDALAAGDGHLPSLIEQRGPGIGQLRILSPGGDYLDGSRLRETAIGLVRHGAGIVMGTASDKAISLIEMKFQGDRLTSGDAGKESLAGLRNWRTLAMGSMREGPVLVLAHDAGVTVAGPRPGGRGFSSLIARPGVKAIAATTPYMLDRDEKSDIVVATDDSRLLHLDGGAGGFAFREEYAYAAPGLLPRAMAGEGRDLWIAGSKGGRATLVLLSAGGGKRTPWIPVPILGSKFEVMAVVDYGAGSLDHVQVLDAQHVLVGGTRDGRAWIGVVERDRRASVHFEKSLAGTAVIAMGSNPSRSGWSIAAGSNDMTFTLLRIPGDPELPRGWNPFPAQEPEPTPTPTPAPGPPTHPKEPIPVDGCGHAREGAAPEPTSAIFPRVSFDSRRSLDTEFVLVFLGARPTKVTLKLTNDTGQLFYSREFVLRRGQRVRLTLAQELAQQRQAAFDGYATVEGCEQRDLVVEALRLAGAAAPEPLPAHWR